MKKTLVDLFEESVRLYPNNTFLLEKTDKKEGFKPTTYTQVKELVYRLGAGYQALGVKKGDNMALLSEGCNMWVVGELAMFYAGAVNVPLSIKLEESNDLLFRLIHGDVKFILVSNYQLKKVRAIKDKLDAVEKIIVFGDCGVLEAKEIALDEVLKMGDEFLASHTMEEFLSVGNSLQNDDIATITYTSGTTADPKGVVLTHRNYTSNVEQALTLVHIDETWRTLIILPLDHCFAHVAGFYTMMSYGASIGTVPSGKSGKEALRNIPTSIKEFKPNVMLSVPTLAKSFKKNIETTIKKSGPKVEKLYNFALNNAIKYNKEGYNKGGFCNWWRKPLMLLFDKLIFKKVREGLGGHMKFFVGGGALLDIDLQRYYYAIGIPMYQGYGLSEATPIISANSPAKHIFGSSGKVVSPMEIKILDADGVEQPFGSKGEICIKGENVMAGYWKNPKSTADTIVDGWLHTGDMGYMRDAEMLYVVGRFKSLLIAADGEKYSPEGIEENLVESSKYIDGAILHNSQDPYTIALITPNKEALKAYAKELGLDPETKEAKEKMLELLQEEVNMYRKGGRMFGAFPERWLPAAVCVLPEPWTEQNHFLNSSMKVVRGRVEEAYKANMECAYTPEGKNIVNDMNMASL